jgi:WD40 repeat protein
MSDSSPATAEMTHTKRSWPKFYLLIAVFLWLLAWELITWFVPIQPRLIIRTDDLETLHREYSMGFSPDGTVLVTSVERDPILPGAIYHLWDTRTGQDLGLMGSQEINLLPNVVYLSQTDLLAEALFPFLDRDCTVYDLIARQQTARTVRCDVEAVTTFCFSPDGRTLIQRTNTEDGGDLRLIDVATGQVRAHLKGGQYGRFAGLVLSHDGST